MKTPWSVQLKVGDPCYATVAVEVSGRPIPQWYPSEVVDFDPSTSMFTVKLATGETAQVHAHHVLDGRTMPRLFSLCGS
jgi:hypothetical protein